MISTFTSSPQSEGYISKQLISSHHLHLTDYTTATDNVLSIFRRAQRCVWPKDTCDVYVASGLSFEQQRIEDFTHHQTQIINYGSPGGEHHLNIQCMHPSLSILLFSLFIFSLITREFSQVLSFHAHSLLISNHSRVTKSSAKISSSYLLSLLDSSFV